MFVFTPGFFQIIGEYMLSNQKLQNSLNEIKEISRMDTALFTAKGKLVAHTEDMPLPEALEQQVVV